MVLPVVNHLMYQCGHHFLDWLQREETWVDANLIKQLSIRCDESPNANEIESNTSKIHLISADLQPAAAKLRYACKLP